MCSTPFRHHGGRPHRRNATRIGRRPEVRCSTPFRHHGERTPAAPTLTDRDARQSRRGRSTPFRHHGGCHALHTKARTSSALDRQVLNALRHHGGWHDGRADSRAVAADASAQRLSASRTSSLRRPSFCLLVASGAQRLSASRTSSRDTVKTEFLNGERCSTPFGITEGGMTVDHASLQGHAACSTPFGITEGATTARAPVARRWVLNAFRHHGGLHHFAGATVTALDRVLNAFRHHGGRHVLARRHSSAAVGSAQRLSRHHGGRHRLASRPRRPPPSWSAQRLSASRRASPRREQGPARVLNAFRHHGGRHTLRSSTSPRARSAQRLSASRRASRGSLPAWSPDILSRCSTPFGITEGVTTGIQFAGLQVECSTPFGITEGATTSRPPRRSLDVLNAFRHHGGRHS